MALYIAELSGESFDISLEELKALFETTGHKASVKTRYNHKFVLLESSLSPSEARKLAERSSMLKLITEIVKEIKSLSLKDIGKVNWSFVQNPFCVRIEDLTGEQFPDIEARLAGPIFDYLVHKGRRQSMLVSLSDPKTTVLYVITKRKIFVTNLLWKSSKGRFVEREPNKKPAFHPTSLKPKLARAIINLARAQKGSSVLDPFCGTGSVLIEAAILGCRPIGLDIDALMIEGSKKNLKFYNLRSRLLHGNATILTRHFKANSIDAIATDPPYGRSTKIGAKNITTLYREFFDSAHKVLKKGKYLVALYPNSIKAKQLLNGKHWKIAFESSLYVHAGLTRKFLVLRKR